MPKTKTQIYSDTKMFIAKTWKSSIDVIQNDDKDAGTSMVRGISEKHISAYGVKNVYIYNYNVTFKIKENKYKIIIDNVYCESANHEGGAYDTGSAPKVEPFDDDKGHPEIMVTMIKSLKQELQLIVDSYESYIKKPSSSADGW